MADESGNTRAAELEENLNKPKAEELEKNVNKPDAEPEENENKPEELEENVNNTGTEELEDNVNKTGTEEQEENVNKTGTEEQEENVNKTRTEEQEENVNKTRTEELEANVSKTGAKGLEANVSKTGAEELEGNVNKPEAKELEENVNKPEELEDNVNKPEELEDNVNKPEELEDNVNNPEELEDNVNKPEELEDNVNKTGAEELGEHSKKKEMNGPIETIFTWRIENAYLFWQKTGEELVSPTFVIDWLNESSWNLCLYPMGIKCSDGFMSVFIAQEKKIETVTDMGAKFELYLLAADGSKVQSEVSEGFLSMKKNGLLGYPCFIRRKTLMDENGTHYLPDETLTLCCRIWCRCEGEFRETVKLKVFARTRIRKEVIERQMAINPNESEDQNIGTIKLILQKVPLLVFFASFDSDRKTLAICGDVSNNTKIKSAMCDFILVDFERKVLFWKNRYLWPQFEVDCIFASLSSESPENSKEYVPKETFNQEKPLYLACRFAFTDGSTTQNIEMDDHGNTLDGFFEQRLSVCSNVIEENPGPTVSDGLRSLYYDPKHHDVILKGRNIKMKVHEMIVAPRSEVFAKMLKERDRETNLVQINNEDDDTLQRVVYFLYTDEIQDMHWEVAKRMYKAGIKYKIELLKDKCSTFIKKNLSASNVSDIVVLIKNEKGNELKEYITNFIIENESEVVCCDEWRIFTKFNPILATEYMVAKWKVKSIEIP